MEMERFRQRMKLINLERLGTEQPHIAAFATELSEINEDFSVDRITLDANGNTIDIYFELAEVRGIMCISEFDEQRGLFGWMEMMVLDSENGISDLIAKNALDTKRETRHPALILRGENIVLYERIHGVLSTTEIYEMLHTLHRFRSGILRQEKDKSEISEDHPQIEANCIPNTNYSH